MEGPAGYRRGDVLSAVETAVWGIGKGHGRRGHLQGDVNETMRMDKLRERQQEGARPERSPLLKMTKEEQTGDWEGLVQEGRREESKGRLEGSPFFGADRHSYQLIQEPSQPEAQPLPHHKSS